MPRLAICAALVATLLFTACTQAPAPVDLKGQNSYGRGSADVYAADTPAAPTPIVYSATSEPTAAVQPISAHDITPPTPAPAPVAAAPQPQQPQQASINQWTHRPHFSDTASSQQLSNLSPTAPAPTQTASATAQPKTPGKPKAVADAAVFMWPVANHKVISKFGPKGGGKANDGISIASGEGEPVWASADGEVLYVGDGITGYGNMVLIKHNGDKTTTYAHLSRATVDKYDRVKQGDIIGYVGATGNVKEPQLHFAIHEGKTPVDPQKYLNQNLASAQ